VPTSVTCDSCSGSGAKTGTQPTTCPTCSGAGKVRASQGFFTIERTCPSCQGRGEIINDPCSSCSGSGRVVKERNLSVNIPAGVEDGTRIRLAGEGEAGLRGGPAGDLYIFLSLKPHEFFQRDGADIFCRVPISMTTAALGGHIDVPTVDGGKTRVKVPEGTETGKQFRLKGKGMPVLRSKVTGDMYIQVDVETPKSLTRRQRELLEEFERESKEETSPHSAGFFAKVKEFFEGKPNWFEHVAAEHRATRERVALFDLSSFTKFEVTGKGAFDSLQRVAANDLDKPDGSVVYTQLCNEKGGIEADLTIVRLAADHFYVVTGSGFAIRDGGWLRQQGVELREVTSSRAVINVQGPRSRELLSRITEDDVSNAAFPYLAAREIRIGYAPVRALRVTYAGELGWELHVPSEYALHLYEALWEAGRDLGVANAGYRALDSLRLEKGYRYWSSELSPDTNPYEVGLGFAVALEKGDFIGREALRKAKASVKRKLACFLMDGFVPLHGGEAILHEGKVIETVTSGGYGHSVGKSIAYGFVPVGLTRGFEIESFGKRYPAQVSERAPYDPERRKIVNC